MIGTHSINRRFAILVTSVLVAVVLASVWGCNSSPVSAPDVGPAASSPFFSQRSLPQDQKTDVATTVGTVDAIDYAAMRLRVGALWFRADAETEIEFDGCGEGCAFDAIAVGDAVTVKHEREIDASGAFYAREIEVENEEPDIDEVEAYGTVSAVDGSSFEVSGTWFWTDAATTFEFDECATNPLIAGDAVKVEYAPLVTPGLGFHASKVEVKRECGAEEEDD